MDELNRAVLRKEQAFNCETGSPFIRLKAAHDCSS